MFCKKPNDAIYLRTENETFSLNTIAENGTGRAIIGINNIKNERRLKADYPDYVGNVFFWFKGLFKWLYLLNLFVGLANLIPLGIVDGGRILQTFLTTTMKDQKRAHKIWKYVSIIFLIMLLFGLLTYMVGNPFTWF